MPVRQSPSMMVEGRSAVVQHEHTWRPSTFF